MTTSNCFEYAKNPHVNDILTKKNPRIENFNPQNIFQSPQSLEIWSPPPPPNSIDSEKPKVIRSSKICTFNMICDDLFYFLAAFHTAEESLPLSKLAMVLPRRASEYPICNYVHSYFISPSFRRHFFEKKTWALQRLQSRGLTAIELTKTVCTQGPGAHFCARAQGLDLVLGHRHLVRILAWVCLKKWVCSH